MAEAVKGADSLSLCVCPWRRSEEQRGQRAAEQSAYGKKLNTQQREIPNSLGTCACCCRLAIC